MSGFRLSFNLLATAFCILFGAEAASAQQLITNRKNSRELIALQETPLQGNVYDLSFVAYDAAFAEEFGIDTSYVTEMDKGLRFLEIRMVTEGKETNCYYNLVLDKSIKLDFPDENFIANTSILNTPTLPENYDAPTENRKKQNLIRGVSYYKSDLPQKFRRRTFIGNPGYKFNTSGKPFSEGSAYDIQLKH